MTNDSELILIRVRDYVVKEKETAAPMVAWELGITRQQATKALVKLVKQKTLIVISPAVRGKMGGPTVYGHAPLPKGPTQRPRMPLPETQAVTLGVSRGEVVPFTGKQKGYARKALADSTRQKRGHRLRTSTKR